MNIYLYMYDSSNALIGVGIISVDALGEFLGPKKKDKRQRASHGDIADGADASIQRAKQRPV